jgi:hypothetical protein
MKVSQHIRVMLVASAGRKMVTEAVCKHVYLITEQRTPTFNEKKTKRTRIP